MRRRRYIFKGGTQGKEIAGRLIKEIPNGEEARTSVAPGKSPGVSPGRWEPGMVQIGERSDLRCGPGTGHGKKQGDLRKGL